jgi:hypothetical protein
LVFLNVSGKNYVFALLGNSNKFSRYDVAAGTWATMTNTPDNTNQGAALTTDGTNIYALQGNGQPALWRYNVAANSFSAGECARQRRVGRRPQAHRQQKRPTYLG